MRKLFGLILILTMLLTGCSYVKIRETKEKESIINSKNPIKLKLSNLDEVEEFSKGSELIYRIGPGDVLNFSSSDKDISNLLLTVGPDGYINFTKLGMIKVKGKNIIEVEKEVNNKIKKYYSYVSYNLSINQYNNYKAYIVGEAVTSSELKLQGNERLFEILTLSKRINFNIADLSKNDIICGIFRENGKKIWISVYDLIINGNQNLNVEIKNKDIIYLTNDFANKKIYIYGEVVQRGLLEVNQPITLTEAILRAGGPNSDANIKKVFLLRFNGKKYDIVKVKLNELLNKHNFEENIYLNDKDIVFVDKSGLTKFNEFISKLFPVPNDVIGTASSIEGFIY